MKRIFSYIGFAALLGCLVWLYITQEQKSIREAEIASERILVLQTKNENLKKLSDSLSNEVMIRDKDMGELERKADSLGEIAETLEMPCEHALELRSREVEYVRMALKKCKEAKTIQTTRVGLSDIRVENQVELCGEVIQMNKSVLKSEKRKSFFKGMGVGGLAIGILIILAL